MINLLFALLMAFLPPCQAEDSDNCGWNAQQQGNQIGTSFIRIGGFKWTIAP